MNDTNLFIFRVIVFSIIFFRTIEFPENFGSFSYFKKFYLLFFYGVGIIKFVEVATETLFMFLTGRI